MLKRIKDVQMRDGEREGLTKDEKEMWEEILKGEIRQTSE